MQATTILENEYMVAWDRVTRADVVRAINEYERLGPERFFSEHGFAPTTTYELTFKTRRSNLGHGLRTRYGPASWLQ